MSGTIIAAVADEDLWHNPPSFGNDYWDCLCSRIVRRANEGGKLVVSILDDPFYVTTTHQLGDHVWLGFVVPGDDVRMGTKADHGLGFAGDAGAGDFVQALSFSSRVLG